MAQGPKYGAHAQILINALQASEMIDGLKITATLDAANCIARNTKRSEMKLFDFADNGDGTFTVRLRDDQPQPPTP